MCVCVRVCVCVCVCVCVYVCCFRSILVCVRTPSQNSFLPIESCQDQAVCITSSRLI